MALVKVTASQNETKVMKLRQQLLVKGWGSRLVRMDGRQELERVIRTYYTRFCNCHIAKL